MSEKLKGVRKGHLLLQIIRPVLPWQHAQTGQNRRGWRRALYHCQGGSSGAKRKAVGNRQTRCWRFAELLAISSQKLIGPTKESIIEKGRALLCHWAVRELGMAMAEMVQRLKVAVPTVSVAVEKGVKSLTTRVCCYRKS